MGEEFIVHEAAVSDQAPFACAQSKPVLVIGDLWLATGEKAGRLLLS